MVGLQPGYKLAEHEEEANWQRWVCAAGSDVLERFWRRRQRRIGECAYERAGRTGKAKPEDRKSVV